MDELVNSAERPLEWHFIGPIQSNKTRAIAQAFDWVQSVDRLKIAERLAEQRPANLPLLNVLLQVNVSGEASKGGVAPDQLSQLAAAVAQLPRLRLRGDDNPGTGDRRRAATVCVCANKQVVSAASR